MNERIARRGNEEDRCTGRFWEGRFHSQALLDEAALLQCMAYVDLNPIRADLAETPEESEYTSVKHRLDRQKENKPDQLMAFLKPKPKPIPDPITDFAKKALPNESNDVIPITFLEYLDLLDWTGRIIREDKTGHLPIGSRYSDPIGIQPKSMENPIDYLSPMATKSTGTYSPYQ